jgi:hypothetical protein
MTWEMPDRNWLKLLSPTIFFGLIAFVILLKFFSGGEPSEASYESSCNEQGGEWLLNATRPTCVFPGGKLVVFDGPPFSPSPTPSPIPPVGTVVAADDTSVPATDPAPACGSVAFANVPLTDRYSGRPHKPDFSTWPEAAKYRTAITKDVAHGVNFAGAYVLARWGMPPENEQKKEGFAIVEARTGKILNYGVQVPCSRY